MAGCSCITCIHLSVYFDVRHYSLPFVGLLCFGFQVREPDVLIFDEATSALDNASERVVQVCFNHLLYLDERQLSHRVYALSLYRVSVEP